MSVGNNSEMVKNNSLAHDSSVPDSLERSRSSQLKKNQSIGTNSIGKQDNLLKLGDSNGSKQAASNSFNRHNSSSAKEADSSLGSKVDPSQKNGSFRSVKSVKIDAPLNNAASSQKLYTINE